VSARDTPIAAPSPNHDARPAGQAVDILLIHYTGMPDAAGALARLCDPEAKVSAHYLIDEDGTLYALVPEDRRAWHAGVSRWAGATDINARSIGIELVNPGPGPDARPFAEPLMLALEALARDVLDRHPIPPWRVLGHSDVAPERKQDPGETFDWRRLARHGIGLWPHHVPRVAEGALRPGDVGAEVAALQGDLARFGYGAKETGVFDTATVEIVTALQRHWRPARVDGVADSGTRDVLAALLALKKA
jgi:N-acetylmuramoyl-L-alanine amidase